MFCYYYISSLHGAASRIFSAELIACVSWSVVRQLPLHLPFKACNLGQKGHHTFQNTSLKTSATLYPFKKLTEYVTLPPLWSSYSFLLTSASTTKGPSPSSQKSASATEAGCRVEARSWGLWSRRQLFFNSRLPFTCKSVQETKRYSSYHCAKYKVTLK